MKKEAIRIERLKKYYNNKPVLEDINLVIYEEEIFGLLGPNGAGKSTLMECIVGLRPYDYGEVYIDGESLGYRGNNIKEKIGFVPQDPLLYDDLTVEENIRFFASMYDVPKNLVKNRIDLLTNWLNMHEFINKKVKILSGGQKRRAGIAVSLIHEPDILILDEPTTGLDPNIRREFWNIIKKLNEDGKTIVISTHYMEEADELCERVGIINDGKILDIDAPIELKRRYGGSIKIVIHVRTRFLEKALEALAEYNAELHIDRIIIPDRDESDISEIKKYLLANDIIPESIEVKMPTLEDVFIHLTGRRLGDNE